MARMAAMKPRTGDGPLEVTKEGRGIVMRVPLEGGGRLVVEMTRVEASELGDALLKVVAGWAPAATRQEVCTTSGVPDAHASWVGGRARRHHGHAPGRRWGALPPVTCSE